MGRPHNKKVEILNSFTCSV